MTLPLTENVNREETDKEFDFVYFASNISKACDLALEAFGIAHQRHPEITLDVVGNYTETYMSQLSEIIAKYGISDCVRFEGKLPSHEDVMNQIRKSRFALLPLKIDLTSGTIRESMANGLPVLTTITQGTPNLNKDYPCVLLSEIGDHQKLADNMCSLLEDDNLVKTLKENGYKKASSKISNTEIVLQWVNEYRKTLNAAL
jgi:glycosyltransferase involved in cell wall biosynthesis